MVSLYFKNIYYYFYFNDLFDKLFSFKFFLTKIKLILILRIGIVIMKKQTIVHVLLDVVQNGVLVHQVNVVVRKAIVELLLLFVPLIWVVKQNMASVLTVDVVQNGVLVHQVNVAVKRAIVVLPLLFVLLL